MRVNVEKMLNEPITVLMCVKAKDSGQAQDLYYPHVLRGSWSIQSSTAIDGDGTQTTTEYARIQIPRDVARFVSYEEAIKNPASPSQYTVGENDVMLRRALTATEPLTKSEVNAVLKNTSRGDYCRVRHVRDLTGSQRDTETIGWQRAEGLARFASIVYIEGV